MVITKVGVLSFGKIMAAVQVLMGLIIGVCFALISMLGSGVMAAASPETPPLMGAIFGVGAIIAFPLFYGVMGFVGGVVMAALYNLVAGTVGGVELDVR